jgi:hypothetical protein
MSITFFVEQHAGWGQSQNLGEDWEYYIKADAKDKWFKAVDQIRVA